MPLVRTTVEALILLGERHGASHEATVDAIVLRDELTVDAASGYATVEVLIVLETLHCGTTCRPAATSAYPLHTLQLRYS